MPDEFAPAPSASALAELLSLHAPLAAAPLCPGLRAHRALSLVTVWEAAERLAGRPLPAPFWAYPWAGGCALARVLLDSPERVRGRRVLDFGAGGGVTSIAAALCGAARVVANDIDPWALAVAQHAAHAQGVVLELDGRDLSALESVDAGDVLRECDVVLCSDLSYERSETPRQRALLERAAAAGALVLVADAGRTYFDATGMTLLAEYDVDVPADLEGGARRHARVFEMAGPTLS